MLILLTCLLTSCIRHSVFSCALPFTPMCPNSLYAKLLARGFFHRTSQSPSLSVTSLLSSTTATASGHDVASFHFPSVPARPALPPGCSAVFTLPVVSRHSASRKTATKNLSLQKQNLKRGNYRTTAAAQTSMKTTAESSAAATDRPRAAADDANPANDVKCVVQQTR